MAKYEVTHSCGHTETHQLFGKVKDREWRISKMEGELCTACFRAKQEAEAKELEAELELPELEGSEKQVKWATSIRGNLIKIAKSEGEEEAISIIARVTSAKFFIEHRDDATRQLVEAITESESEPVDETPAEEWKKVAFNIQNVSKSTEMSIFLNMPHNSEFDGYGVWVSRKLVHEGAHSYQYCISVNDSFEFVLKKYGKGKWNKFTVLDEKKISVAEFAEAFGGFC